MSREHHSRPLLAAAVVAFAAFAAMPSVRAAETQPTCFRFVDPVNGNDNANGSLTAPWKTIFNAMYGPAPVAYGDVVVLLPGIYSPSTNGEFWPLFMRDGVSLQGTNALNTILQGEADEFGELPTILYFFSGFHQDDFADTLVDGVTITNGKNGILLNTEFIPVRPSIANCFIVKNECGVRITSIYHETVDVDGYVNHAPRLANDTIASNDFGIVDEGVWVPTDPDPDGTENGEADSCIVNCLVYPNSESDLSGVDDEDIVATAFCTFDAGGESFVKNSSPSTYVAVCGLQPFDVYVWPTRWDYRIKRGSPLIDAGTTSLVVANGTIGRRFFQCGQDIFDVDCEGYFNHRLRGAAPDIGADEVGQLILAGYAPKTTDFTPAFPNAVMSVNPDPVIPGPLFATVHLSGGGLLGYTNNEPLSTPGVRPRYTTAPSSTSDGLRVVNPNFYIPGTPATIALSPAGTFNFQQSSATAVRRNMQALPMNATQQTTLSNLQSYRILP